MTHTSHAAAHADHAPSGSAMLPAIGAIALSLIWGLYTIAVFYEIVIVSAP